jgi:pyruvate dehydrogenase E2 component (dihydrolipoamide acetyltransferase)
MVAREVPLVMPKMSMTMTEGTFLVWHKAEGDPVRQGDVVCEVATDKVDMEVEATVSGTLTRLVAAPEDVIPVGEPIAYVASETEDLLGDLFDPPGAEPDPDPEPPEPESAPPPEPALAPAAAVSAVPAARRLAARRGIDLATITPTGPHHTIRLSDIDGEPSRGRAVIARRMSASAAIPQFVLYRDIDLEAVAARRAHGWTAVLTHAFATALRRHPELNASWVNGSVLRHEHVAVALAVDTPRGLLAPVLTDPDRRSLAALAATITDVAGRARAGRLDLAELTAPATTTLSNLGGFGVTGFQALLSPPQATALAIGAVEPKAVPLGETVGIRLRCTVGLGVDHRVADGVAGARLLATLQEVIAAL